MWWSLFSTCNLIIKRLQHRCFPLNFAFLNFAILQFWIFKARYFVKHLRMAASERLWCNIVLPYPWIVEIWKNLIKRTRFIKTCSFIVLECSFQFNDNFLNGILLGDFFVTKQLQFILRMFVKMWQLKKPFWSVVWAKTEKKISKKRGKTHTLYHKNIRALTLFLSLWTIKYFLSP